jgi:hypothetical protein
MKKIRLFVLTMLLVSPLVFAVGEKTFNWTPPTQYEDATTLPQTEIASYDIECDGVLLVNVPNQPLDTDQYAAPPGTFATGNHSCVAYTITTEGVRSGPSNAVNFTVAPGIPNPPVLVLQ